MISPRLCFRDIDPEHWIRLVDLMMPPPGGDPEPAADDGPLSFFTRAAEPIRRSSSALAAAMPAVALHRGGKVVRLFQVGGGTLDPSQISGVDAEGLREFRRRRGLPFAVAVDIERLPAVMADVQSCVALDDDFAAQQLAMTRVFQEALDRGDVRIDPRLFGAMPVPSFKLLQLTLDRLLPDRKTLVFYLIDQGRIWTSLIVGKRDGDIHLVTTHAAIADKVHFASMNDARAVIDAVTEEIDPPHVGIFLPLRVWRELVAGDRAAIARAMTARKAVLSPAPAWLLALVGVGAVAEGVTRGGRLASKLLSRSRLGSQLFKGLAAEKLVQTLSSPLESLGLDPWEFLRWGRDWRRRIELDRAGLEHTKNG